MSPSHLSPGGQLLRYEIVGPLGHGGMGDVYRARDPRLGRDVAIKVLSARLVADADARERFEREARAVAALSHPNILAIHDFGSDGGTAYQPVVKVPASTETGDAPRWQGARSENIGHI